MLDEKVRAVHKGLRKEGEANNQESIRKRARGLRPEKSKTFNKTTQKGLGGSPRMIKENNLHAQMETPKVHQGSSE